MTISGPNYPLTVTTTNTVAPYDDLDWTSATAVSESTTAEASITAATYGVNSYSYLLIATGFGFAIPDTATIDGIKVSIEERCDTGSAVDGTFQLVFNGSVFGSDKASVSPWSATQAVVIYGATNDLWGSTASATDINDSTFGLRMSVKGTAASSDVFVNYINMTIDYTEASASQFTQSADGAITPGGAVASQASKRAAGVLQPGGAIVSQTGKGLAGAIASGGVLSKQTAIARDGGLTFEGVIVSSFTKSDSETGELTSAGAITLQTGKQIAGQLTGDGSVIFQTGKKADGALSLAGELSTVYHSAEPTNTGSGFMPYVWQQLIREREYSLEDDDEAMIVYAISEIM